MPQLHEFEVCAQLATYANKSRTPATSYYEDHYRAAAETQFAGGELMTRQGNHFKPFWWKQRTAL